MSLMDTLSCSELREHGHPQRESEQGDTALRGREADGVWLPVSDSQTVNMSLFHFSG